MIFQLQIYTKYTKGSDGLPPIKTTCAKLLYFSDYDSLRDVRKKKPFEKSIQIYCIHSQFLYYVKKTKINIIIASIFITLNEINNETHYVANKIKNKTKQKKTTQKKQPKTAPIGFAL